MTYQDKIVLVTGGGSGIGQDLARAFAAQGATVVVSGRRNEALEHTVKLVAGDGGRAAAVPADATRSAEVAAVAASLGYRSEAAFSRAFTRIIGTPRAASAARPRSRRWLHSELPSTLRRRTHEEEPVMPSGDVVLQQVELGMPWQTIDPFLFCVHHDDDYPEGDEDLGPCAPLVGRDLGADFSGRDGWSMYHGSLVPGFPQHPHRGFETISFMRRGFMDHADSLGAAARFGRGDVQWMTAGSGIVHAEMFPLLNRDAHNQTELFQIWINLPASDKMVPPHFSMLWSHQIPRHTSLDAAGRPTEVTVVAGELVPGHRAPAPPPHSWASRPDSDVGIYHAAISPEGSWRLGPAAHPQTMRTVYVFRGGSVRIDGVEVAGGHAAVVRSEAPIELIDTGDGAEVLVLQGRPIGEPVVQYGPFVMNTRAEIQKAYHDYQETHFGGWPWPEADPNHGADLRRFAKHADGRLEELAAS